MNQDDIKPFQTIKASDARKLRKAKKEKMPRQRIVEGEHTKALRAADAAFSIWYRAREADEQGLVKCCTCGKVMFWKTSDGSTHFGHFKSRGFSAVRFSEYNGGVQCHIENTYREGEQVKMREYLVNRYGEEEVQKVEIAVHTGKRLSDFELREIAKYYRAEARKLIKTKGLV